MKSVKNNGVFKSWRSYWNFRKDVTRDWRYQRSPQSEKFLLAVEVTSEARVSKIPSGHHFYRAQVAHGDDPDPGIGEVFPGPALPSRMVPFRDRAREGRVNPKGIPCLYVAGDEHTAIAESRPWIGSLVSVAVFRTNRDLRVVDCTNDADKNPLYLDKEPSPAKREKAVWAHIARAFTEPVTRDDDIAEYAPTQIIAERFRSKGLDGIAYRSSFGTDKFNLALFSIDVAEPVMCSLHKLKDVKLDYDEIANPYYVQTGETGQTELVRNAITEIRPISK